MGGMFARNSSTSRGSNNNEAASKSKVENKNGDQSKDKSKDQSRVQNKHKSKDQIADKSKDPIESKSIEKRTSKKRSRKRIGKRSKSIDKQTGRRRSSNDKKTIEPRSLKTNELPVTKSIKSLQSVSKRSKEVQKGESSNRVLATKQVTQPPDDLTDTTIEVKIQIKPSPQSSETSAERRASTEGPGFTKLGRKSVKSLPGRAEGVMPVARRSNEGSGTLPRAPFNSFNQSLMSKSKADLIDQITGRLTKSIKGTARDPLSLGQEKSRSGKECRICLQLIEDELNSLQPCACTGSQAFVHKHCLHEWIRIRGSNKCDVCNNEYSGLNLVKQHRGFIDWITSNPLVFAYMITGIVVGFFFFYVLFIGYLEFKTSYGLVMNSLRILLLVVTIVYTILFSIISVALITKGVTLYLAWRRENYTVTLGPLPGQLMGSLGGAGLNVVEMSLSNQPTIDRTYRISKQDVNDQKNRSVPGESLSRHHQGLMQEQQI